MAKKKTTKFKEAIGIDIGTHSVKMVHLRKTSDSFKLINYSIKPTIPDGIEYIPSDLRKDRYIPVILEMMRSLKINPKKVSRLVSAVGGEQVSIKQIKTIFLPDDELESALFFEAKKHLAIAGGEMILDFQVLSVEEKTNNMNVLLVATTKEHLKAHTEILTAVGLTPHYVDVETLAVANSYAFNAYPEDGVYIILNIGAHRTNMVVYSTNSKFFARDIDFGGYHITKDIMRKYDLSFEEAEIYKTECGTAEPSEYDRHASDALSDIIHKIKNQTQAAENDLSISSLDIAEKPALENIALEVKRSLRYYVKDAGNSDFKKVLIVGGTAKLPGIREYLEENINIPCEVFDPFYNVEIPDKYKNKRDPQLALAIGLAMRKD